MKNKIPTITSPRLILRALKPEDAQDIFNYAHNEAVTKYVFWKAHKTINDAQEFIRITRNSYKHLKWMWGIELKKEKVLIGTCGFVNYYPINKCVEVGYALNPQYWHQGYTKEALNAIIDYSFKKLDIIRIEGICVSENLASANTMLSCKMRFEGIIHDGFIKNDQIHDCKLFALTKRYYLNNN